MANRDRPYQAYLLRCWREDLPAPAAASSWRFALEEILHDQRHWGFGSLEVLLAFLRAEFTAQEDGTPERGTREENQEK